MIMSSSLSKCVSSADTTRATSIDPFVLDFGSSVNISEELNRTIRLEIKAIDDDITSLQNENKTEERVYLHHRKDFSHALNEMNRLSRDAHEDLEQARVREHLCVRLRDSIETDISNVLMVVTPLASPTEGTNGSTLKSWDKTNMDDAENSDAVQVSSRNEDVDGFDRNLGSCAEKYKLELKRLSEYIKKDHTECLEWLSKINSLEEECTLKKAKVDELSKLSNDVLEQLDKIQQDNLLEKQQVERLQECIEKETQTGAQLDEEEAQEVGEILICCFVIYSVTSAYDCLTCVLSILYFFHLDCCFIEHETEKSTN